MENQTVNEGKTAAIISYITIFGAVAAFIMNNSKKNSFTSFHIRQMIGLTLLGMVNQYVITKFLGGTAGIIIAVILFVLWVIGFVGAIKGEEKLIPVLGDKFQDWFKGL
ncbi:MAG: hypothetical protein V3V28_03925 [Polaribacter sp.]|uniref:DUF4870 domain-containing protein n=1 Tax=Polaribacter sp. TaxID=1920175 RepID=UPI002F35FF06